MHWPHSFLTSPVSLKRTWLIRPRHSFYKNDRILLSMMKPYNFSLRQIQYAVTVADTRNFRRAAERCHVSQPSLSVQVAELETGLGVQLFERDRRGVMITTAGSELIDRMRRVLLEVDDVRGAARRFLDPLAGTLRIGVIPTVGPYLLPTVAPLLPAPDRRTATTQGISALDSSLAGGQNRGTRSPDPSWKPRWRVACFGSRHR